MSIITNVTIPVIVDSRLRFPKDAPQDLVHWLTSETSHKNPEYSKKKALGLWVGGIDSKIRTWRNDNGCFSVPRGLTAKVRLAAAEFGYKIRWLDRRVSAPVEWGPFLATPRRYQEEGIAACIKSEQGIVRAPTGCLVGNTIVTVNRAGRSFDIRMSELVKRWTNKVPRRQAWEKSVMTEVRSRTVDGFIHYTRLLDAYESGNQPVFSMLTKSDHHLVATGEHRIYTDQGWRRLNALGVGSKIWVEVSPDSHELQLTEVVDLSYEGVQMTYDLSVETPNNFLANGIVVHNSGKTLMALACLPRLGQRSIVIVRDRNLLEQWIQRAEENLGIKPKEIGIIASGKRRVGKQLTVALQQTLYSKAFDLQEYAGMFGAVVVDEVHDAAARTVQETVDAFPARVRVGFSADHTRKDRKEFLIEDLFGNVIFEVGKDNLEKIGAVVPVVVRLVPTDFRADWYANAPPEERDFTKLVTEMSTDQSRGALVRQVVQELVKAHAVPALVFTHRREYAARLAEEELPADGIPTGLLLGSAGNAEQFEESKTLLLSGVLKVAVGTFKAVGQGIDIPNVMAGVCATPIGANRQFFGQVRGRICRVVPGKRVGHLYYIWDRHVFPESARNLCQWNDGLVEVYNRDTKGWVSFR